MNKKKVLVVSAICLILVLILALYFIRPGAHNSEITNDQASQDETALSEDTSETETSTESANVIPLAELPTYVYEQREITLTNNNQTIYGVATFPITESGKAPLVICSHGLGANFNSCMEYAKKFAMYGLAAYCFDFRGGGGTRSEGLQTDMSVMTEVSDLEAVLENSKDWDFVDSSKTVLFGESQGGIVSAIVAARHPDDISGLILEYPAFVIPETVRSLFESQEDIPDSYTLQNLTLGRAYAMDVWDYDVFSEIGNYKKKVLILHGDEDKVVPISYSERAVEVYEDTDYHVFPGAEHGFVGSDFDQSLVYIFDYLQTIGVLKAEPVVDSTE